MNEILSKTISLHSRVRHRQVGDESVLVCMHSGEVLVVNQVGAYIVGELAQARKVEKLLASVCETFDVSEARARNDLIDYLQKLDQQDVVVIQSSSAELD